MTAFQPTLGAAVAQADQLREVLREDLQCGDRVLVTTGNSTYSIQVIDDDLYDVSGGWFDRQCLSPWRTTITGCSWAGSAIKLDIVAACGHAPSSSRMEFFGGTPLNFPVGTLI